MTTLGKTLGRTIAKERASADMTQEVLASKIGISTRSLQSLEAGDDMPRYTTLFKIARALELEPEVFIRPMWMYWQEQYDPNEV